MMLNLVQNKCPKCESKKIKKHRLYKVGNGDQRQLFRCDDCGGCFSETWDTPLANLKTPISIISLVLNGLAEGLGINAAVRLFGTSKGSIYLWQGRLSDLKETLVLYALCHKFLQQLIEGDELYTKVGKNVPPDESKGWTVVLMDRVSRFLWELSCGRKDRRLFRRAMKTLCRVIEQTENLSLLTDGERCYGNLLFEICHEVLHNGKRGRPPKSLARGVKVRVKNKGSQSRKKGRKRPKYQAPHREHPETRQDLANPDIHANHVEAFNSSLRRRCAAYRRKTNTYAKNTSRLQERLDVYWIIHNFVRSHFTTKQVPAVALGILDVGLSIEELFHIQKVA